MPRISWLKSPYGGKASLEQKTAGFRISFRALGDVASFEICGHQKALSAARQYSNVELTFVELDEAIRGRRSIRKYVDKPVSMELVREVLEAGTWAPSAKNGQQWRFTVLTGNAKERFMTFFRSELEKLSARIGVMNMGSSFGSCTAMEEAPVLMIVWNANESKYLEESSLQSVAAAIQNMLLKAYSLGLGSLWICDVYYARKAIGKHFGKPWMLVAAVALGWQAIAPEPKRRRTVDEVTDFLLG